MFDPVVLFFAFIIGALMGSFSNVVILRLPVGKNIAFPGSHCFSCKAPVRWYDNIPLLSWLILKGRCRSCKSSFSIRYFFVELLMSVLFVLVVRHFGWSLTTLEFLIFTFGLVTVSFIDLDHMILPDVFTLSGIILGLLGALINPERSFTEALYGVLFGGGFLYAVAWAYFKIKKIEGMGGGDIKLIAWIGAYLGVSSILPVIIYSSFIGAFVGLILMVFKKKGFQSEIPFGPFLAFAALIVMFFPSLDPLFFLK